METAVMTHFGSETYLDVGYSGPAYTWTTSSEVSMAGYRSPEMPPHMNADGWEQSTPQSPDQISQSTPMPFHSHALAFAPDTAPATAASSPSTPALVVFDDHCDAAPLNAAAKSPSLSARRIARRPNPVAVPNLTKKARGRAVPTTKDTLLKGGSGRSYACPVKECCKVFTRSEHLKRHTRSIHTNEKPFRCEELNCGRLFTRHDNLLQHLKNHRHDSPTDFGPLERVCISPSSPSELNTVSPTMGVLIPPQPRMSLSSAKPAAYTYTSSLVYEEATAPRLSGDVSSPDGTPAPANEPSFLGYQYGFAWPQSDIRSIPHAQQPQYGAVAAAAEPRYLPTYRDRIPSAAYSYNV